MLIPQSLSMRAKSKHVDKEESIEEKEFDSAFMAIGIGKDLRKDVGKKIRRENTLIN